MAFEGTESDEGRTDIVQALLTKLAEQNELLARRDADIAERDAGIAERDAEIAERDAEIAEQAEKLASVEASRARLREQYDKILEELALLKRRLFVATAERVDTSQLQLEFAKLNDKLKNIAGQLPEAEAEEAVDDSSEEDESGGKKKKKRNNNKGKPKGRRNLADADLPQEEVVIEDPLFEDLVAKGQAERIGTETSYKLAHYRPGFYRLAVHHVKYRAVNAQGKSEVETARPPAELIRRCLAAPSILAHIATSKFCDGLPLYRLEEIFWRSGATIDRGTMSRWLEDIGANLGASIIEAARRHFFEQAFCIMTDATGFAVQPGPREGGPRRPCRKGHYFVQIADRDHIFFEFTERHTTKAVRAMFKGYEGYVQADAASVYDALFRADDPEGDGCSRTEVACWSHTRRKYWEAAFAKEPVARQALLRIGKIFELDASFRAKGRPPPSKIKRLRDRHLRPLVEEFLQFAQDEYEKVKHRRGSLRSALGYSVRQADALRAFLADGRLRLDNNPSESALRKVVRIRDASLFAGSTKHAESAGNILSLIASARMHELDPEAYLRDIIRVLPHWPKDRYLELSPKFWAQTRERLDSGQLRAELGPLDVPELTSTPE